MGKSDPQRLDGIVRREIWAYFEFWSRLDPTIFSGWPAPSDKEGSIPRMLEDCMYRLAAGLVSLLAVYGIPFSSARAQQVPTTESEQPAAIRMFLDCQRARCDREHFRREVNFVNHVRDRRDAQVHVLVTSQGTGGGSEYTFLFIGLQDLAGHEDTLRFLTSATDTEDERREGQTRTLKMGLMRFVAATPMANDISILYRPTTERDLAPQANHDPWNHWVFRISAGGDLESESRTDEYSINGSISANRTTEMWKTSFFAGGSYNEDRFELDEDSTLVSTRSDWTASARVIRSLGGEHWAAGSEISATKSTRFNQDLTLRWRGALEYSVFPYSESTRRSLTLLYTLGVASFDYEEITLFDKTEEVLPEQELSITLSAVQPWGSASTSVEGFTFLHDLSKHRIELSGRLRFRLLRGLDLNLGGSVARIKDQIYLSGVDIPDEDILLERRQLGTDFRIDTYFSLSYRFGSIFNNVVNPRMGRGGGGGRFFF